MAKEYIYSGSIGFISPPRGDLTDTDLGEVQARKIEDALAHFTEKVFHENASKPLNEQLGGTIKVHRKREVTATGS